MKTQIIGAAGEKIAKEYLISKGYLIEAMNFHSKYGEIDIIAKNDKYIVFVEVKTRKQFSIVSPAGAVTKSKRNKIIKTAFVYMESNIINMQPRFDVIEIITKDDGAKIKNINHIENAFCQEEEYAAF